MSADQVTPVTSKDVAGANESASAPALDEVAPDEVDRSVRDSQAFTPAPRDVTNLVKRELAKALVRFPSFNSPHEGKAVIEEELEELWAHVKANTGRSDAAMLEAIQVAAMAMRYVLDLATEPAAVPGGEADK